MQGPGTDGPVLSKIIVSFGLNDPCPDGIGRNRIGTDDQAALGPGIPPAKMMRPDPVKKRRKHHQYIQACFIKQFVFLPNSSQSFTGVSVVGPNDSSDGVRSFMNQRMVKQPKHLTPWIGPAGRRDVNTRPADHQHKILDIFVSAKLSIRPANHSVLSPPSF